jgi:hypothetical protein
MNRTADDTACGTMKVQFLANLAQTLQGSKWMAVHPSKHSIREASPTLIGQEVGWTPGSMWDLWTFGFKQRNDKFSTLLDNLDNTAEKLLQFTSMHIKPPYTE